MLCGHKAIRDLDNICGAAPNVGLWGEVEARTRSDTTRAAIDNNQVTEGGGQIAASTITGHSCFLQIARNRDDDLHKKKVEQDDEQNSQYE
jgi:hypothetical protein